MHRAASFGFSSNQAGVPPELPSPSSADLTPTGAARTPPAIETGAFHAYFVYDLADTIDLAAVERLVRAPREDVARAPLQLRREASSGFIEFPVAPVVLRFPGAATASGNAAVRAKIFDYGVISVRLTLPFCGSWDDFAAFTRTLRNDAELPRIAGAALASLSAEITNALDDPHPPLLEDYFVFEVQSFARPILASELLGDYGQELASLVLCERRRLMPLERAEALRVNFAYFEDDLAIVQWDTAFVYDRPESASAVEDILEFANTQLAELRTYDALLDAELDAIYKRDPKNVDRQSGRNGPQRSADRLRYLIVDIHELTDRSTNALKIIGDAYYARLYRGAAGRLGLKDWQFQIETKLQSVRDLYRFFHDEAQSRRGEFLEVVVIVLIFLEVIIGLVTLRR
jgi:hypothetical protein